MLYTRAPSVSALGGSSAAVDARPTDKPTAGSATCPSHSRRERSDVRIGFRCEYDSADLATQWSLSSRRIDRLHGTCNYSACASRAPAGPREGLSPPPDSQEIGRA